MVQLSAEVSSDPLGVIALTQINRQLRELREAVRLKKEAYLRARQENKPSLIDLGNEVDSVTHVLTVLDRIIEKFRESNLQLADSQTISELNSVKLLKTQLETEKRKLEATWLQDQVTATSPPNIRLKRKRRSSHAQIQRRPQNVSEQASQLAKKFIEFTTHELPNNELRGMKTELRLLIHQVTEQREMLASIRREMNREKRRRHTPPWKCGMLAKQERQAPRNILRMRDELQSELRQLHILKNSLERLTAETKREYARFKREKQNFIRVQKGAKRTINDYAIERTKNAEKNASIKTPSVVPILSFSLNGELYGMSASLVLEIIRGQITSIVGKPSYVAGLMKHHGIPIPVLNLKTRLGLSDSSKSEITIVVQSVYGPIGLTVDEACDVLNLSTEKITKPSIKPSRLACEYIVGVSDLGANKITCLNVEKILKTIQLPRITTQTRKMIANQTFGC